MKSYTLVLLLKRDLKKDAKDKLLTDVKKLFGEAKNEKLDSLGEKKLTYPIKRELSAEYVVLNFDTEKLDSELNKRLLLKEEIMRHLLIKN